MYLLHIHVYFNAAKIAYTEHVCSLLGNINPSGQCTDSQPGVLQALTPFTFQELQLNFKKKGFLARKSEKIKNEWLKRTSKITILSKGNSSILKICSQYNLSCNNAQ